MVGGTALALQIGHRKSEDFDIFFLHEIPLSLKEILFSVVEKPIVKRLDNENQLTITCGPHNLKITLAKQTALPLHPSVNPKGLPLFNLADLASNKAYTVGRRGVWRDYVDLFFLLKENCVNLAQVIKETEKRFGSDFSPKLFLEQLIYVKDIVDFKIDYLKKSYETAEIVAFFKQQIRKYLATEM